jgi:hypothetical protein
MLLHFRGFLFFKKTDKNVFTTVFDLGQKLKQNFDVHGSSRYQGAATVM